MRFITIIPARGGSKRFQGKNTHVLAGKPLICHSIDYSLHNPNIIGTYVSTDSENIKKISVVAGAEIIDRPAELADDFVTTAAAMKHAVEFFFIKMFKIDIRINFFTIDNIWHGNEFCVIFFSNL